MKRNHRKNRHNRILLAMLVMAALVASMLTVLAIAEGGDEGGEASQPAPQPAQQVTQVQESAPEPAPAPQSEPKQEVQPEPKAEENTGSADSGNTGSGNTDSGNNDSGNTDSGNTDSGNNESGDNGSGNTEGGGTGEGSGTEGGSTEGGNEGGNTEGGEDPDNPDNPDNPDDPDDSGVEKDPVVITGFTKLEKTLYVMTEKPSTKDEARSQMSLPETLSATLSDGSTAEIRVTWDCSGYDSRDTGEFVWSAAPADAEPALGEGVELPAVTLRVLDGGEYTIALNDDGTLTITAYNGSAAAVVVPEKIEGYEVSAIADGAFAEKANLESVELPNTLKTLGSGVFRKCEKLTKVVFPDSLEEIGGDLFKDSDKVDTVVLRAELDSTLTNNTTVTHKNDEGKTCTVQLPMLTDIEVKDGTLTIDSDLTVEQNHAIAVTGGKVELKSGRTITNKGTINGSSGFTNGGTVISCSGKVSGVNGAITQHKYVNGFCSYCGAAEPRQTRTLTIKPKHKFEKVYDGTRNMSFSAGDFTLDGVEAGDSVTLVYTKYAPQDGADIGRNVGTHKYRLTFAINTNAANKYDYRLSSATLDVDVTITPKTVTITPARRDENGQATADENANPQSKTYGLSNPRNYMAFAEGFCEPGKTEAERQAAVKALMSGGISRVSGEDVGEYEYTLGTLSFGDNYTLVLKSDKFVIEPKSIVPKTDGQDSQGDVVLRKIGNQRYTGSPVEPPVVMTYGKKTLQKDVDFTVTYSNNTEPGQAMAVIEGKGNYTGTVTVKFRILKVTSASHYSGGRSGGYRNNGFEGDTDEELGPDEAFGDIDEMVVDSGVLVLGDINYGTILFNDDDEPRPFEQFEEMGENGQRTLIIQPFAMTDESTGATVYLGGNASRERYEELHLRLTPQLVDALIADGFTDLVYELEYAEMHVALEDLGGEIDLQALEDDGEYLDAGDFGGSAFDEMDEADPDAEIEAAEDAGLVMLTPDLTPVDEYDICIEQVTDNLLTPREKVALDGYEAVLPMYRLNVIARSENDIVGMTTEYPALGALSSVELKIVPEHMANAPDGAVQLFVSDDPELDDADAVEDAPALFIWEENVLYGVFEPEQSGLYAIVVSEQQAAVNAANAGSAADSAPAADNIVPDPDPYYAYIRRTAEDIQYWIVDTAAGTVEWYSTANGGVRVGAYTGSLMSGMDVDYGEGFTAQMQLKFPETYKFANLTMNGEVLLLEQTDVDAARDIVNG